MTSLANRYKQPLGFIFFDIDNFKTINDQLGHHIGDQVLCRVAKIVQERLRTEDLVARWGGEEFIVALQNNTLSQTYTVAEALRAQILQDPDLQALTQGQGPITISLGITQWQSNDNEDIIFKRLDSAMYEAKAAGKNQTCEAKT